MVVKGNVAMWKNSERGKIFGGEKLWKDHVCSFPLAVLKRQNVTGS